MFPKYKLFFVDHLDYLIEIQKFKKEEDIHLKLRLPNIAQITFPPPPFSIARKKVLFLYG